MNQNWDMYGERGSLTPFESVMEIYDNMDGPSEEEAYLQGNTFFASTSTVTHKLSLMPCQESTKLSSN